MPAINRRNIEAEIARSDEAERPGLLIASAACRTNQDWLGVADAIWTRTGPLSYQFARSWRLRPAARALFEARDPRIPTP